MIMKLFIFFEGISFIVLTFFQMAQIKNMTFICQNIDYVFLRYIVEILLLNI